MLTVILKLILTGAVAAAPPGPVAVLILQKTLCHGKKGGLCAGTGSGLVDTAYAALALFAVSFISAFLERHKGTVLLAGGVAVAVIGLIMAHKKTSKADLPDCNSVSSMASFPIEAALCALANPGAFALMLGLIALFGISPTDSGVPVVVMLMSVWCGEMIWWALFTTVADKVKENISEMTIPSICRIAGYVVTVLGSVLFVKGLYTILN